MGKTSAPLAGTYALILGVAAMLGTLSGLAFGQTIPPVISWASHGAAVLEIGLAPGLLRRNRAAWAFAVALECTMSLVSLIALAPLLKLGSQGHVAIGFAVARAILAVILIVRRNELGQ